MDIVIARAVHHQQVAFELAGEGDGGAIIVAIGVVFGQRHVAFLVDGVIEALVGNKGNGHSCAIELGMAEHHVQGHGAPAAPSPDAHAVSVEIGARLQDFPAGRGLVLGGEDPDLLIDRFPPGASAGRGSAAVVDAHHHVSLLGQHEMPEISITTEAVEHGLAGWFSVDIEEKRVFLVRVEVWRLDAPGIEFDAVPDRNPEELHG